MWQPSFDLCLFDIIQAGARPLECPSSTIVLSQAVAESAFLRKQLHTLHLLPRCKTGEALVLNHCISIILEFKLIDVSGNAGGVQQHSQSQRHWLLINSRHGVVQGQKF
jgi:hypothetical protein